MKCFHNYAVDLIGDADARRRALELFEESLVPLVLCDIIDNLDDEDDGYFEDVDGSEEEDTLIDGVTMIDADYDGGCDVDELLEGFQEWAEQLAKEKVDVEFYVSGYVEWGERYSFSASYYEGGKFTSNYGLSTDDDESEGIDYDDDEEDDEE